MPSKVSSRSARSNITRPKSKPPPRPSSKPSTANSRATNNSSPPKYYKRPPLPMPLNNRDWPEAFGFTIGGDAPSYIISVEGGSHAHNAGLQPGDQLVELHNQNVTQLTANAIKSLAQQCPSIPPSIVVVSCVKTCELIRDKYGRYGMTLIGGGPVYVEVVEAQSPAERAGMKSGDMVLEINGLQIRHSDDAKVFVHGSGRLKMVIIPGAGHQSVRKLAQKFEQQAKERAVRAEGFFRKLDAVFYNDPAKKDTLITLLKQYAKDKKVDNFGRALANLLNTTPQRQLFDDIRIFVPPKHRQRFDYLVSKDVPQSGKRIVRVDRSGGSFGFMLVGDNPVMVESVDPGGAAERSGLKAGDRILKLNGLDVRKKSHNRLITLLQGSGSAPTLVVETGPPVPSGGYSTAASTIRSVTTSQSRTTSSDTSSVTGWLSESATSRTTRDDLDVTRDLAKMDLYTVGRTFKEMMEHHLTAQERKLVKRALQGYQGNRNLDALIVEIFPILDTNAKRTLWPYIIQILPEEEQEVCKRKVIYLIDRHAADDSRPQLIRNRRTDIAYNTSFPPSTLGSGPTVPPPPHLESELGRRRYDSYHDRSFASLRSHRSLGSLMETPRSDHLVPSHADFPYTQEINTQTRRPPRHSTGSIPSQATQGDMPTSFLDDVIERPLNEQPPQPPPLRRQMPPPEHSQGYPHRHRHGQSESSDSSSPLSKDGGAEPELTDLDDIMPGEGSYYYHDSVSHRKPKRHSYPTIPEGADHVTSRRGSSYHAVYAVDPLATVVTDLLSDHGSVAGSEYSRSNQSNHHGLNANNNSVRQRYRHGPSSVHSFDARSEISNHSGSHHSFPRGSTPVNGNHHVSVNGSHEEHPFVNGGASLIEEDEEPSTSFGASPPPPPPPPPVPPMAPPPPPVPDGTDGGSSWMQQKMTVKRLNWEKIQDTQNTVWSEIQVDQEDNYLGEVIKRLELEDKFSTVNKPKGTTKAGSAGKERKATVNIIAHKKAHNTAILLGHLRMPIDDIRAAILAMDSSKFSVVQLQQMYSFSPSDEEVAELEEYEGKTSMLSQPDKFAFEMSRIPAYKLRVEALQFIAGFDEQIEEIAEELATIKQASDELRASQKLAKVLELVLAMGNYMNKGNQRVAGAVGFKITFLTELDTTKTSDNKSTFLHVVAKAVNTNMPDALSFGDEIPSVPRANKMSLILLGEDLNELEQKLQVLSESVAVLDPESTRRYPEDRFTDAMTTFKSDATDRLQNMKTIFTDTREEFNKTAQYFGEDPKDTESDKFFGIFSLFITKFARAHHENLQNSPRLPKTP